jgi:4-diphosphocytidyl-2-C-methyl-D-erythritol kinase
MGDKDIRVSTAHAKINLGLKIISKMPSGYHSLETGYCFIEWSDQLEVSQDKSTFIDVDGVQVPTGKDNLIVKAAEAFRRFTGKKNHYRVNLKKNIPLGAGLGGGSADAAAMIRIMNKMEDTSLTESQLTEIGATIGSDVPILITGKTALGTGTGTILKYLPIQPRAWIITVFPGIESLTTEAYANCIPTGDSDISLEKILTEYHLDEWRYLIDNDLEPAVIPRYPVIGNIKDQFYDLGAVFAAMSGSGSAVYGFFEQEFVALDAYHYFVQNDYQTNITRPGFQPDTGVYRR